LNTRRKGHDPVHAFRASAELVAEARRLAKDRGESMSDVIRSALERYVNDCPDPAREKDER
jgi:predicted DNA-binding protein